jgi:hypothetical protein
MKSKKNQKIKHGKVEIPENAFDPENVKARITMWIGMDVLQAVKSQAREKGLPYQTYLNQVIRASVLGKRDNELETRLANLESTVNDIRLKIAG